MSDKCPFCGAGPLGADPTVPYFDCWMPKENPGRRTHKCLMNELAAAKKRLEEAEGLLKEFCSFTLLPANLPIFKEVYDKTLSFLTPDTPAPEPEMVTVRREDLEITLSRVTSFCTAFQAAAHNRLKAALEAKEGKG